ncbi:MAG: hypothetical protein HY860_06920 [Chlamydiales bacterium]|nr:hypothetical protein [Chlamydiales bacterium]
MKKLVIKNHYLLFLVLSICGFAKQTQECLPAELTICSHLGAGFFAELHKVVDNIIFFDHKNLQRIYVDWTQEFFPFKNNPHENGWDLYFDSILINKEISLDIEISNKLISGSSYHALHDQGCIEQWMSYDKYFPYRLAIHDVIKKHIKVKDEILNETDRFYEKNMERYYCIGVHVRYGCDHAMESPKGTPTVEDYILETKRLIQEKGKNNIRIFLATDSHYVVQQFDKYFPGIALHIPAFRSNYREEPHLIYGSADYWKTHPAEFHRKKPAYFGGKGVLMDCLLLSKCDLFIHSSSNIADFVTFFNPYIQSIYLPKNNITWPCRHNRSEKI